MTGGTPDPVFVSEPFQNTQTLQQGMKPAQQMVPDHFPVHPLRHTGLYFRTVFRNTNRFKHMVLLLIPHRYHI